MLSPRTAEPWPFVYFLSSAASEIVLPAAATAFSCWRSDHRLGGRSPLSDNPSLSDCCFFRLGILPRLSSMILTLGLIRNPQLLLLQPLQFAGRLPPGRASNRNQKKNGRGLRPLHVLYMGPFWGPILLLRPPPHMCSVLVVYPLLPSSVATRPQLLLIPRLEKGY